MAETVNEDSGVGRSVEESSNGQDSQSGEALSEWRSSGQVENGTPSTSPPYWDTDEDDDYGRCFAARIFSRVLCSFPLCITWMWLTSKRVSSYSVQAKVLG